jgi:hypothetical protein
MPVVPSADFQPDKNDIVMLGGSRDILRMNFQFTDLLKKIERGQSSIIIGDCPKGADMMIQNYIAQGQAAIRTAVYHTGGKIRYMAKELTSHVMVEPDVDMDCGGRDWRAYFTEKDRRMCFDCTLALFIWNGLSKGIFRNIQDLRKQNTPVFVWYPHAEQLHKY